SSRSISSIARERCGIIPAMRCTTSLSIGVSLLTIWASAEPQIDARQLDRARVLRAADAYLKEQPITVTASRSDRSAGGVHDFFSEGDYWWPDPKNPDGPYIQRDGMTNPDNFVAHRHAMIRFAMHVASLTAAYRITGERRYADHAIAHLR